MQILLIFFIAIALPISLSAQSPLGLNHEETHDLRTLEKEFDSHIDRQDMHVWMREMSSRPHHIGSEWNKHNPFYCYYIMPLKRTYKKGKRLMGRS